MTTSKFVDQYAVAAAQLKAAQKTVDDLKAKILALGAAEIAGGRADAGIQCTSAASKPLRRPAPLAGPVPVGPRWHSLWSCRASCMQASRRSSSGNSRSRAADACCSAYNASQRRTTCCNIVGRAATRGREPAEPRGRRLSLRVRR